MWWKTRCLALEYENYMLREAIRNLRKNQCSNAFLQIGKNLNDHTKSSEAVMNGNRNIEDNIESPLEDDKSEFHKDDNLEFHLDEDMMSFLAQSARHKRELYNKKKCLENTNVTGNENDPLEGTLAWVKKRSADAELLYGQASSKILAMETALQTTIERHSDKVKPQYWPNIPLKF